MDLMIRRRVDAHCHSEKRDAELHLQSMLRWPHDRMRYVLELFQRGRKVDTHGWHLQVCSSMLPVRCLTAGGKRRILSLADALCGEGANHITIALCRAPRRMPSRFCKGEPPIRVTKYQPYELCT